MITLNDLVSLLTSYDAENTVKISGLNDTVTALTKLNEDKSKAIAELNEEVIQLEDQNAVLQNEIGRLQQIIDSFPKDTLVPGQVKDKCIIGMSTDNFDARMTELGRPIGADHFFVSSWSVVGFMQKVYEAEEHGLFPYGNMKVVSNDWKRFGSSAADAEVEALAEALAEFGKPVRVTFHHEPGFKTPTTNGEGGTPQDWVKMAIRQYPRLKNLAPNVVTGPVINGFICDPNIAGQGWSDDELNSLFTDEFFDAIDAFGGDYYDGSTSRSAADSGKGRAVLKIARADAWLRSRGLVGKIVADVGEFNFIKPVHCDELTDFFATHADLWWMALNFNSDLNNRANIPTIGGLWNLSHGYDTQWDRRDAFRRMLDHPLIHP